MTTDHQMERNDIIKAAAKAGTAHLGALALRKATSYAPGATKKPAVPSVLSSSPYEEHIAELRTLLRKKEREQEAQDRFVSATLTLLNKACAMLDEAEEKLEKQEGRIQHLETLATSDELTGLQNRRGFYEVFTRELDRCARGQSKGGLLVLIDMDNFKHINDTYGHLAGDAALRLVARTLRDTIRVMDVAARLGGDEFVLLFSNTTKIDAAARGQELAKQLNNLSLAWYGHIIPVRASVGFRSYDAGDTADDIYNAADAHLYDNKRRRAAARKENA